MLQRWWLRGIVFEESNFSSTGQCDHVVGCGVSSEVREDGSVMAGGIDVVDSDVGSNFFFFFLLIGKPGNLLGRHGCSLLLKFTHLAKGAIEFVTSGGAEEI